MSNEVNIDSGNGFNWSAIPSAVSDKVRIWFTKTSDFYSGGVFREFKNLDDAITSLLAECSTDGKYGKNPELIIFKEDENIMRNCDYTIEFYDDWRE